MDDSPASFVGRQAELAALGRIFIAGQPRLIAVTGPAGAGKTRLVRQAIIQYANLFEEVRFLTIQQTNPARAAFTAAAANGLLVLDGLQDAPDNGQDWLNLLPGLPAARIILTARTVPPVPGLLRLRLDGLPVPSQEQKTDLACNTSVELFLSAVRQGIPDYDPSQEELERIASYCRHVHGLPGDILRTAIALVPHPL